MKWMHRGNAWHVAGVADPGYSCNGNHICAGHVSKRVSVNRTFSADVSCYMDPWGACPRLAMNAAQLALTTYCSAPQESFADRGDKDFSPIGCAAVFKKENALPRSELHFSVHNRYGLAGARQNHADV